MTFALVAVPLTMPLTLIGTNSSFSYLRTFAINIRESKTVLYEVFGFNTFNVGTIWGRLSGFKLTN